MSTFLHQTSTSIVNEKCRGIFGLRTPVSYPLVTKLKPEMKKSLSCGCPLTMQSHHSQPSHPTPRHNKRYNFLEESGILLHWKFQQASCSNIHHTASLEYTPCSLWRVHVYQRQFRASVTSVSKKLQCRHSFQVSLFYVHEPVDKSYRVTHWKQNKHFNCVPWKSPLIHSNVTYNQRHSINDFIYNV